MKRRSPRPQVTARRRFRCRAAKGPGRPLGPGWPLGPRSRGRAASEPAAPRRCGPPASGRIYGRSRRSRNTPALLRGLAEAILFPSPPERRCPWGRSPVRGTRWQHPLAECRKMAPAAGKAGPGRAGPA